MFCKHYTMKGNFEGDWRTIAEMRITTEASIIDAIAVYNLGCMLQENDATLCKTKSKIFTTPLLRLAKEFDHFSNQERFQKTITVLPFRFDLEKP